MNKTILSLCALTSFTLVCMEPSKEAAVDYSSKVFSFELGECIFTINSSNHQGSFYPASLSIQNKNNTAQKQFAESPLFNSEMLREYLKKAGEEHKVNLEDLNIWTMINSSALLFRHLREDDQDTAWLLWNNMDSVREKFKSVEQLSAIEQILKDFNQNKSIISSEQYMTSEYSEKFVHTILSLQFSLANSIAPLLGGDESKAFDISFSIMKFIYKKWYLMPLVQVLNKTSSVRLRPPENVQTANPNAAPVQMLPTNANQDSSTEITSNTSASSAQPSSWSSWFTFGYLQ